MTEDLPHVLIVDDNPKNIQVLGNILRQEGYRISIATHGERAIANVSKIQPDLILLDVMMPDMDGFSVCRKLKSLPCCEGIPVIFLTARTDYDAVLEGFRAGGADYVTKPFRTEELLARVRTHLRLRLLNQHLEELVRAKTRELSEANLHLERFSKAKTEFIGLISYGLRNPLNNIINLTTLIEESGITEEQREDIVDLRHQVEQMTEFSELAILITSARADHLRPELEDILLHEFVEELFERLWHQTLEKRITLENRVPKTLPGCQTDRNLLVKCLEIVFRNAIRFSPPTSSVSVDGEEDGHWISLRVRDRGPGFTPEALESLFEPFSTGDLFKHSGGFNLRMAAVKLILQLLQIEIRAENHPEGGAVITLAIPKNVNAGRT